MGQVSTAFRAFFAALFSQPKADALRRTLDEPSLPKVNFDEKKPQPAGPVPAPTPPPKRSEAITLLATLQREARLVDLVLEPLGEYTDEQIGAAARNVLRDSAEVLRRLFALEPVLAHEEQTAVEVPPGYDPARLRLTGKVDGSGPFRGKLAHRGWQATTTQLPTWTGSKEAALVIAPAEIEI
jgi:hypothetical protein